MRVSLVAIILPTQADVTEPKGFPLFTQRGTYIDNEQWPDDPGPEGQEAYRLEREKHRDWSFRRPACGRYNCWGLVFALRRTGIYEEDAIRKVLRDEYRSVAAADYNNDVMAGDVVLYALRPSRILAHAGLVVDVRHGSSPVPQIRVLSKWNRWSGEDIHDVADVCVMMGRDSYSWEIWTDRPNDTRPPTP
jgi:hypothetical protein